MVTRTLRLTSPLEQGPDVEAMQRLLHVVPADGVYGIQTATAAYRAKVRLGYAKPDHSAGELLVDYLTGKRKPTAAMVKRAGKQPPLPHPPPRPPANREELIREAIVATWHLLIANATKVHYPPHDIRPTEWIHTIATRTELLEVLASHDGLWADCSQTVSMVSHVAGAKCPDGDYAKDWAADGYTGTLIDGCDKITKAQARIGDLHVYGAGTGHHVAQKLADVTGDALMGSHGSDPPRLILDSDEARYQPWGGVWLRLPI